MFRRHGCPRNLFGQWLRPALSSLEQLAFLLRRELSKQNSEWIQALPSQTPRAMEAIAPDRSVLPVTPSLGDHSEPVGSARLAETRTSLSIFLVASKEPIFSKRRAFIFRRTPVRTARKNRRRKVGEEPITYPCFAAALRASNGSEWSADTSFPRA